MALNKQRGANKAETLTVPDYSLTPAIEGTIVTYAQATSSISVGATLTYNAVTVGNAFGTEGSRVVSIEIPESNTEYFIRAGGAIAMGDRIGSDANGFAVKDATNVGPLIAMSAGIPGQYIVAQKKIGVVL